MTVQGASVKIRQRNTEGQGGAVVGAFKMIVSFGVASLKTTRSIRVAKPFLILKFDRGPALDACFLVEIK